MELHISEFIKSLSQVDWFYDYSDDSRAYAKGAAQVKLMREIAGQGSDLFKAAFNAALPKEFSHMAFKLSTDGQGAVAKTGSENQTNKTENNTPIHQTMNPMNILGAFLNAICIAVIAAGEYLRDNPAIDLGEDGDPAAAGTVAAPATTGTRRGGRRSAAATAAAATPATAAPATAAVTTTAAPATAAAAGTHTAESLRALATPLVNAGRGAEVKALCEAHGAQNIGTLDPAKFPAFHAGLSALIASPL